MDAREDDRPAGPTGDGDVALHVYPSDQRDGWEPGAPSLRAMAPSLIGGAVVPLAVYYLVRHRVHGDATALVIAGVPALLWVAAEWLRKRRVDPIGAIVTVGFVAGVIASVALGGNAFVLKARDAFIGALFGIACLLSLRALPRPMMFYIGRAMSAGDDPGRQSAYDALWELLPVRRVFRVITVVWGGGLIADAGTRIFLAAILRTGPFLAVSPVIAAGSAGAMFAFTVWYTRWARQRIESPPGLGVEPA